MQKCQDHFQNNITEKSFECKVATCLVIAKHANEHLACFVAFVVILGYLEFLSVFCLIYEIYIAF